MAAGLLTLVLAVGGLCASPSAPAGGACRAALPNGRQAPAHIAASPAPRRAAPLCTASAARARTDDASAGDADERQPLGFSFSVGGLLFAYQLGVGRALVDEGFIVPGVTPLSGASSGVRALLTARRAAARARASARRAHRHAPVGALARVSARSHSSRRCSRSTYPSSSSSTGCAPSSPTAARTAPPADSAHS